MEPLTALGLAANVAQFLGYGIKLIATAKEVHNSSEGVTQQISTLDTVYGKLGTLSSVLRLPSQPPGKMGWDAITYETAIQDISRVCQDDCDKLLELTKQLKRGDGHSSRFSSFKTALKTMRKSDQINELEQRLHRTQQTLTLHICSLTSIWQSTYNSQLSKLKRDQANLNFHQNSKLVQIQEEVKQLGHLLRNEASSIKNTTTLSNDITGLEDQMNRLALARVDMEKQHAIIRSLNFESRSCRYEGITVAHEKTFQWVLKGPESLDTELASGSMIEWLRHGQGIYWISGKPGSGKSTLMKFISTRDETRDALMAWSLGKPLIIGSHFFWAAGTSMQKSLKGLLRTLLFDILRQQPDLVAQLCPERWRQTPTELSLEPEDWGTPELSRILQSIPRLHTMSTNFCFFIDGLDEYEGDHVEICKDLQELARSPKIKICVASRPWNAFKDAFGASESSKMYVHELTRNDIYAYVDSSLHTHPRWAEVNQETARGESLADRVTERSAGVFLWVYLATRELRSGLSEYDSFAELEQRLDTIPGDLGAFFRQILETVNPFHHQAMAEALLLSLAVREPAPITVYYYLDKDHTDPEYVLTLPLGFWSSAEESSNHILTERRLSARCRGLLQVNTLSSCVEPLHRTVLDFLRTQDMEEFLRAKMHHTFDVHLSATRAFIAYIKSTWFEEDVRREGFARYNENRFSEAICEVVSHAKQLEERSGVYQLLEHLEAIIPEMHRTSQVSLLSPDDLAQPIIDFHEAKNSIIVPARLNGGVHPLMQRPPLPDALFMREYVIKECLAGYVDYMACRYHGYLSIFKPSMMMEVLDTVASSHLSSVRDSIPLAKVLTKHRFDLNGTDSIKSEAVIPLTSTPWKSFIFNILNRRVSDSEIFNAVLESDLIHLMLQNGADPYFLFYKSRWKRDAHPSHDHKWLKKLDETIFPKLWLSFFVYSLVDNRLTTKAMACAIRVLDQTIEAFTTLQSFKGTSENKPLTGGPEGFLACLDLHSLLPRLPHNCNEQAPSFWAQVAERLLAIAKLHEIDIDGFLPTLQLTFPGQNISPMSILASRDPPLNITSGLPCKKPMSSKRALPWADEESNRVGKQKRM
ncbi:hypothetical protein PG990_008461 [Apiospora arundinis]|uniref:NACHT domain-containing protein n=1 Tax=Apiospora arundinis TaxID=335852 RepID=A0ABR2JNC6_9PEZI